MEEEIKKLLNKFVEITKSSFGDNLVGVYLHGSLALGAFNKLKSDIDLLVVVKKPLIVEEKQKYQQELIQFNDTLKISKGLELSVVLEKYTMDFEYPTPYEYHFGTDTIEKYRKGYIQDGSEGPDPDLANHFMIVTERGKKLFGEPISKVFRPFNTKYYIASNYEDVKGAKKAIIENPVYTILNLCRFLKYLKIEAISSKAEGGKWFLVEGDGQYKDLVDKALKDYVGASEYQYDEKELRNFAKYMLKQIDNLVESS